MDVPLREIQAPGARRPLRVTPKSMGVLLVLVDNADKVVSRDTLLAEVWPDTLPSNDVVTQAVTQLRKAFAAADDGSPYIETIAKGGYRLLAEVEWLAPQPGRAGPSPPAPIRADARNEVEAVFPGPGPAHPLPRPQRGGLGAVVGAAAVAALLVGLLSGWALSRRQPPPTDREPATVGELPAGLECRAVAIFYTALQHGMSIPAHALIGGSRGG